MKLKFKLDCYTGTELDSPVKTEKQYIIRQYIIYTTLESVEVRVHPEGIEIPVTGLHY